MTKHQTPATIKVTLEIELELYAFAAHAAELQGLTGPGPYITRALSVALDESLPEPVGPGAAELAKPGPALQGAARTRPYLRIAVPLARQHARAVIANFGAHAFFNAQDMLHGLVTGKLMDLMTEYEDRDLAPGSDWRPEWLRKRLDLQRYDGDEWPF